MDWFKERLTETKVLLQNLGKRYTRTALYVKNMELIAIVVGQLDEG